LNLRGSYKFIHDRVQEAAYSLVPGTVAPEAHLRIGRLLAAHTPRRNAKKESRKVVNQLNRRRRLDHVTDER